MLKLNYDTKEFQIELLSKLEVFPSDKHNFIGNMSATRHSYHNVDITKQKQAILSNIYELNNCLIRNIFLFSFKNRLFVVDGKNTIDTLNNFLNNEFEINFLIANNKLNPKFSDLKSADKRKFNNFYFRTTVIEISSIKEGMEILDNIGLIF